MQIDTFRVKPKIRVHLNPAVQFNPALRTLVDAIYSSFCTCKNDENFIGKILIILIFFAQNVDCGYTLDHLGEAALTSTHNLCFGSKIRKVYPCKPQFYFINVGYKGYTLHRHVYVVTDVHIEQNFGYQARKYSSKVSVSYKMYLSRLFHSC